MRGTQERRATEIARERDKWTGKKYNIIFVRCPRSLCDWFSAECCVRVWYSRIKNNAKVLAVCRREIEPRQIIEIRLEHKTILHGAKQKQDKNKTHAKKYCTEQKRKQNSPPHTHNKLETEFGFFASSRSNGQSRQPREKIQPIRTRYTKTSRIVDKRIFCLYIHLLPHGIHGRALSDSSESSEFSLCAHFGWVSFGLLCWCCCNPCRCFDFASCVSDVCDVVLPFSHSAQYQCQKNDKHVNIKSAQHKAQDT